MVQSGPTAKLAPSTANNFAGVGWGDYGFVPNAAPPDPNGAVGATQYVQWVNESYAVFDKATGALLLGPVPGNSLWKGFGGGCENNNDGDPLAQYDKLANRWVMTQFSVTNGPPFYQCVAVSTTSDATGSYNRYSFPMPQFNDYSKIGVWPDGYYATFNMFSATGTAFYGAAACAFDRSKMLAGQAATQVCFQFTSNVASLLPSDLDGPASPPPPGSPNYLLNFGFNSLNLWRFHVDFVNPANSTISTPTVLSVAAFNPACGGGTCIPQPATNQQLDSLGDRLMYRLAYRNFGDHEALVVNHSVGTNGTVGVRWYELRNPGGIPTVFQQGTYAPDSNYRWMGSIAMDQAGNIAMGYSASGSTMYPSIYFTGRTPSDTPGTMEAETLVIGGSGSQTSGLNRWGDYSAISVDPVDDCTFWYTNEYLKSTGAFNWSTRIANFKFAGCGGPPPTGDFTVSAAPSSVTINQGSSGSYTATVAGTYTANVGLSASGLPSGATASFNPASVAGSGSNNSVMTVNVGSATPAGSYTVTITGAGPTVSHSTTVTLVVKAAPKPDFSISASPASRTIQRGTSTTYNATVTAVNGFTGVVNLSVSGLPSRSSASFNPPSVAGSAISTLTVTTGTRSTAQTYTLTIRGTSGTLVHTTTVQLVLTR